MEDAGLPKSRRDRRAGPGLQSALRTIEARTTTTTKAVRRSWLEALRWQLGAYDVRPLS